MGRKKKFIVKLKPFCFYCDKEFNNEVTLHQHQKSKHFQCTDFTCKKKKRFTTALALYTHSIQKHQKYLDCVPNAKSGRGQFDLSIYGMDGVPIDLINIKLQEKIEVKKRKLIKRGEHGIELNEDFAKIKKNYNNKEKKRSKFDNGINNNNNEYDFKKSSNFYHNPDIFNITKTETQKNSSIFPFMMNMPMSYNMMNPMMMPFNMQNMMKFNNFQPPMSVNYNANNLNNSNNNPINNYNNNNYARQHSLNNSNLPKSNSNNITDLSVNNIDNFKNNNIQNNLPFIPKPMDNIPMPNPN